MRTIFTRKMGRILYPALIGIFYSTLKTKVRTDDNQADPLINMPEVIPIGN